MDLNNGVDAGKVLHSFCLAENPQTVLDPTVNLVFCVDDDLDFFGARGHDFALGLCACKSADWPRMRRVEIWTGNVSVGQEPDSGVPR